MRIEFLAPVRYLPSSAFCLFCIFSYWKSNKVAMKTICTFILMGLLALAPCQAAVRADALASSSSAHLDPQLTESGIRSLLAAVSPQLESQLNRNLPVDYLYSEYQDGRVQITYLGYDGIKHCYRVDFDGGVGLSGLDNF